MSLVQYKRFRPTGYLANQFDQILYKLREGKLPESNVYYFMEYAKKYFQNAKFYDRANKIDNLLQQWVYWTKTRNQLRESRNFPTIHINLYKVEEYLDKAFKYIDLVNDDVDAEIELLAIRDKDIHVEYTLYKIGMKLEELLFEILSEIYLSIYTNNLITDVEVNTILSALEAEIEKPPDTFIERQVDQTIDDDKLKMKANKLEPTVQCFRRVYRVMKPFLNEFRECFFKEQKDIIVRVYNIEVYTCSILMTVSKIFKDPKTDEMLKYLYGMIKRLYQLKLINLIKKAQTQVPEKMTLLSLVVTDDLVFLSNKVFEETEAFLDKLKGYDKTGIQLGKQYSIQYIMNNPLTDYEKAHLVGYTIKYEDMTSVLDTVRQGAPLRDIRLEVEPFTLAPEDIVNKTLIFGIGNTGGGKTVQGTCIVRSFINSGYVVVDGSLNTKRADEMVWSIMPMNSRYWKKEYTKLTEVQGCQPEKLQSIVLVPYMETQLLPKKFPPCFKMFTIPLKSFAGKIHAYPLLFTRTPDRSIVELVDKIINEVATDDWDLNSLRYFLKRLIDQKQNYIWVNFTKVGEKIQLQQKFEFDTKVAKAALASLVMGSELISAASSPTAIKFEEIAKNPSFVQIYYGHMNDQKAYLIHKWWIFSWTEFKQRHQSCKIAVFMNEVQSIAPSQANVGGMMSTEKYGSSVDVADLILQIRGMGIFVIALTQMPSQARQQFQTQKGVLLIFYDQNEDDLKYAFGDIPSLEMQENLKFLVRNKFYLEEHMCIYKLGAEPHEVRIILGALPPCGIERQNINVFDVYNEVNGIEMISFDTIAQQFELNKQKILMKTIEGDLKSGLIRALEEGKEIKGVSASEMVIEIEKVEKLIEQSKQLNIPVGAVVLPEQQYQQLVDTKPVGENKIVVDKAKYEAILSSEHPIVEEIKTGTKVENSLETIKNIVLGCNPFKFTVRSISKDLPSDILIMLDFIDKLGHSASQYEAGKLIKKIDTDPILVRVLIKGRVRPNTTYWQLSDLAFNSILGSADPAYLAKVYETCALFYFENLPELPWKVEVQQAYKSLKSRDSLIFNNIKKGTDQKVQVLGSEPPPSTTVPQQQDLATKRQI